MKRRIYLFFLSFTFSAVADDLDLLNFIFSEHPACAHYIAATLHYRGRDFKEAAQGLGLKGNQVEAYIERRTYQALQVAYFNLFWREYKRISKTADKVDYKLEALIRKQRIRNPTTFAISLYKEAGKAASMGTGLPRSTEMPFSFNTLVVRPPIGRYEVQQFKILLYLRTIVAFNQSKLTERYLKLPMGALKDLTVHDIEPAFLESTFSTLEFMDKTSNAEMREEIQSLHEVMQRSKVDTVALAQELMRDPKIPKIVRQEIALRTGFEQLYRVPQTWALRLFVGWVHRYFKDTQLDP